MALRIPYVHQGEMNYLRFSGHKQLKYRPLKAMILPVGLRARNDYIVLALNLLSG